MRADPPGCGLADKAGKAASEYRAGSQLYLAPQSLDELLEAKAKYPDAIVLGGGTDLGIRVSKEREAFPVVISTQWVAPLRAISESADALTIGGGVTYTRALPFLDKHFPSFADLVRRIGSRQIRNIGTLAANIANASPIGDTIPCLMALDATITLRSKRGAREVKADDFILAYRKTALEKDEIIEKISIPLLKAGTSFTAYKLSKRFDQDISTVIGAFRLRVENGKVGGIARGLWRHGRDHRTRQTCRGCDHRQALERRHAEGCRQPDRKRLPADDRPSRHRRLSPARRRQSGAAPAGRKRRRRNLAGVGIMSAPLSRIRGGVHQSVRHDSAAGHVTGAAIYLDDIPQVPGALEAALVLSPHPHARIRSIDLSAALAAEGVIAAVTAQDVPGKNDIAPIRTDEPLLATGLVEHEGQVVAAVAATTLDLARAAAKLVKVEYEVLPPVLTVEEAVAKESYVAPIQKMERGDIDAALKSSKHRLKGEFHCGGQDHFYLEGQIAIATPGEGRDFHVFSSTQHPTEVQHGVAHVLGIPFNAVTVEVRRMGGGFGGKESQPTIIAGVAALLAWKTRKPVKLRLPRDDDMRATGKRHPFYFRYDIGFDDDGAIRGSISCSPPMAGMSPTTRRRC